MDLGVVDAVNKYRANHGVRKVTVAIPARLNSLLGGQEPDLDVTFVFVVGIDQAYVFQSEALVAPLVDSPRMDAGIQLCHGFLTRS